MDEVSFVSASMAAAGAVSSVNGATAMVVAAMTMALAVAKDDTKLRLMVLPLLVLVAGERSDGGAGASSLTEAPILSRTTSVFPVRNRSGT
jgi:hypothetical protein